MSKNSKTKPQLYNDLHPEKSLQNTGFKDEKTAMKTLKLIKNRSIKYQFDVVNTMYNRAKFHPHKTKLMDGAIKIFGSWLKTYKKQKAIDNKYKFLPLNKVIQYEKLANEYKVSEVARGIKSGSKTDIGFLPMYKKVAGKDYKLQYIPIKKDKPSGQDYWSYRISFIKARLGQMKTAKTPFFYSEGKYKGLPTKQHIILIMHAYSPYADKL